MIALQDGRDFYDLASGRRVSSYPALCLHDYDLAGAEKARVQFLADHPGWRMATLDESFGDDNDSD